MTKDQDLKDFLRKALPPRRDWDMLMTRINEWADDTFGAGNGNTYGKAKHIEKEAVELMDAVRDRDINKIRKEIADIFILGIHAAHGEGIDLYDAIAEKFEIVKKRKWQAPDEDGVIQHVEE